MFLEQAAWTLASAIIGGSIVGVVVTIAQNHPHIIRRKIRAETLEKLKLDSIMNIVNGVVKLNSEIREINNKTILMGGAIQLGYANRPMDVEDVYKNIAELVGDELVKAEDKIAFIIVEHYKNINSSIKKIEEFIFYLKKDMVINEKDEKVIEQVKILYNIVNILLKDFEEAKVIQNITDVDIENMSKEISDNLTKNNPIVMIEESIEYILKIYKVKLDKKEEGCFRKLLNCPRKVKIILMKKRKRSRLQDKP